MTNDDDIDHVRSAISLLLLFKLFLLFDTNRTIISFISDYFVLSFYRMRLKGQMIYVPETDLVLFLCSPSVLNLDDLNRRGLYLSDIPLHDATRDLILLSEQFEAEYKLTKNLEILTDKLQQTYRELEDEKRKTDRFVLPPEIILFLSNLFYVDNLTIFSSL